MRPRPPKAVTRTFQCPACGYTLELRAPGQAKTIACQACTSILDADDPQHKIVTKYREKVRGQDIPLGQRGTLRGIEYECLGVMFRQIVNAPQYAWKEYLIWNPYHGYHWLVESTGHWSLVKPCVGLPLMTEKHVARYDGKLHTAYQKGRAEVTYVLGEFPWEVRRGDTVATLDYIAPPHVLSKERDRAEVNWSQGEYLDHREVWKAFGLTTTPPTVEGIGAAQPSPYGPVGSMARAFAVFAVVALVIQILSMVLARNEKVAADSFTYRAADSTTHVGVLPDIVLEGRTSNLLIDVRPKIDNSWVYFDYGLVETSTGQTFQLGREVSFYHGIDGGENWSEGVRYDKAYLPMVPSGTYFLSIEPQVPPDTKILDYTVTLRRDVPRMGFFFLILFFLALPPIITFARHHTFEHQRWMESDF